MSTIQVAHAFLKKLGAKREAPFSLSVDAFLEKCSAAAPHRSWKELRKLDWEAESVLLSSRMRPAWW